MNNYFIYDGKKKFNLQDIWKDYYLILNDNNNYINILKQINYFKNFFKIIIKYILYYNIYLRFKIYKNKNDIFIINDFNQYFNWLKNYNNTYQLIIECNNLLIIDLDNWNLY